jgi:F-type H+-transporting ATPase subunit epsilon
VAPDVFGAQLVTPEAALFAGEATAVICRTSIGYLTVLDGHTPLVGDVMPGIVRIVRIERPDDSTEAYCVHGGFLQVATEQGAAVGLLEGVTEATRSTRVTLLAGIAEPVDAIDPARASAARDAASAQLSALASRDDDEAVLEREQAERALARAELRLSAAGAAA